MTHDAIPLPLPAPTAFQPAAARDLLVSSWGVFVADIGGLAVKAYSKCANCYRDFADHNYVADSINEWSCPVNQQESFYGYFTGGDPRDFHPDAEECSPEELANHKRACEEADALESGRNLECPSGWITWEGGCIHVLNAPFGIGVGTVEFEQFFEEMEADDAA